jgi:hypothetical protein
MARKAWVLDTETKGTGAEMVPLDKAKQPARSSGILIRREQPPRPPKEPEPRRPRKFKVVDVMTRQVLAEDTGAQETIELLEDVRSVVDVSIYVWDTKAGEWRSLSLGERRTLWEASRAKR